MTVRAEWGRGGGLMIVSHFVELRLILQDMMVIMLFSSFVCVGVSGVVEIYFNNDEISL